jgi:hypothetical protein
MSLLNNRNKPAAKPLLDYRKHEKLLAAQARRAEIDTLLRTLITHDGARARRAVDEAQAVLDEAEIMALGGRIPDSDLARAQAALLSAKRELAGITLRIRDLEAEAQKLDSETLPDVEYRAKCEARDNLQAEYLSLLKAMLASLEGVPAQARRLSELRDIAALQFPHTYDTQDPAHDYRFKAFAGLPLLSHSARVIVPMGNGHARMDTDVKDAAELTAPLLAELREAIAALEKGAGLRPERQAAKP